MKAWPIALAVVLCLANFTGSSNAESKSSTGNASNASSATETVKINNGIDPRGHLPGRADVSTTSPGKQFDATPNFELYPSCGRPCWLPMMSSPRITKGGSVTDNYPYERFPGNKGDKVHVVCQVKGETIRNESNQASNIWDKVIIPKAKVLQNASGLTATQDSRGYFAYASDLWLGNTGWHKIAC